MSQFAGFTVDNGAIKDLRDLLFYTLYKDPDLNITATPVTGVINGQKLGYIDRMGDVGLNKCGCNPTYSNVDITGSEKEWELGCWQIAKHICYTELENTIAKNSLNKGTDIANLIGTPYMEFLTPLLQKAMSDMFHRLVWFGDKEAKNVADSDGGNITKGIDVELFKTCDGLFKRLFGIIADNPGQKTAIDANAQTTTALQMSKIREKGVAMGIVDNLLADADGRIFDKPDACIMMTNSLFKALVADVRNTFIGTTLTYEQLAEGVVISQYDGRKIIALDIWDRMIKRFENNGTKLNNPHRAVLCSPSNLFYGTDDTDMIADLSITFNEETRYNNIFAQSKIGTLIGEDDLVQVAI